MKILLLAVYLFAHQLFTASFTAYAQNESSARATVQALTSSDFWGRGYVNEGMKKAANYIVSRLKEIGVSPLPHHPDEYLQSFPMAVNTFPGAMQVKINGQELKPGVDYIVSKNSQGLKAQGLLIPDGINGFVDPTQKLLVTFSKKLTFSVAEKASPQTTLVIDESRFSETPLSYEVDIENKEITNFVAHNVAGIVKGTQFPEKYIVMSAHYDHLGGMGSQTYFPGANDNASGTALLIDLAEYYIKNPLPYSVVFLFFGAEEAGLIGSKYFVEHPLLDLNKIIFLTNLDLMGNGVDGITVVNGTIFSQAFEILKKINLNQSLFKKITARGKAKSSDHYWFSEYGVPAFFIYTLGGPTWYHDLFDTYEHLQYRHYLECFKLLTDFNYEISQLQIAHD